MRNCVFVVVLAVMATGCSKIKASMDQAKQVKEAAGNAQHAVEQVKDEGVQKMIMDQQAAMQARMLAEVPQPPDASADADLHRKDAGTGEVNSSIPRFVITGQTLPMTLVGDDFRDSDKVEALGICHVRDVRINSSKQIKLTISTDDVLEGKCQIRLTKANGSYIDRDLEVQLNPAGSQRKLAQMQQQMNDANKHVADIVGKRWDVRYPSGKTDTWTLVDVGMMGITDFKDSSGKKFSVAIGQGDTAMIDMGGCLLQGKINAGRIENGQSMLPNCPLGTGAWSATISR